MSPTCHSNNALLISRHELRVKSDGDALTYFLRYELFSPIFGQVRTDGRTDRQKAMHMSPPCNLHRWAQKLWVDTLFPANFATLDQTVSEI